MGGKRPPKFPCKHCGHMIDPYSWGFVLCYTCMKNKVWKEPAKPETP